MGKFKLAIGLHNHQPVGNFDFVFEDAHKHAYKPFIEILKQYPQVRLSLHQSGILWDWQEKHHRQHLELIKQLIEAAQINLMTGGFYEPILVSIPKRDILGQVDMLNAYLKDRFDVDPTGAWLTERIWEPHLPGILKDAGIDFLPVDDTHFIYAGFEHAQLTGPFVTEYENKTVTLLPISKRLRYLIPFGTVEEVITELKQLAEKNPDGMVVYADDGEKFGSWPKTFEHCYTDGWLKDFFEALSDNFEWLEIIPLEEAANMKPVGRAYLPSASYAEMLHWSLPPKAFVEYEQFEHFLEDQGVDEQYNRFVRGGHWRGFLTKYEESNLMHKKMMYLSSRIDALRTKNEKDKSFQKAIDHLYAAQCNCPYWHGVFGGLYLPHIRAAIYSNLVAAEKILNSLVRPEPFTLVDYDTDGHDEIVYADDALSAVFKPSVGGSLLELSLFEQQFSLTDTLSRRKEGYHLKLEKAVTSEKADGTKSIHDLVLTKEDGLQELLTEDWYLKRCFIDHIFTDEVHFEQFSSNKFGEFGDFVLEPYDYEFDKSSREIVLTRKGNLWKPDNVVPCTIRKIFNFAGFDGGIDIRYELSVSGKKQTVNFGVENNFNFQAGHAEDRYIVIDSSRPQKSYLDSAGAHNQAKRISLVDEYRDIAVAVESADLPAEIWHLPIQTVSLSEGGFEKVYQGTTIVHRFWLTLSEKPTIINFRVVTGTAKSIQDSVSQKANIHK